MPVISEKTDFITVLSCEDNEKRLVIHYHIDSETGEAMPHHREGDLEIEKYLEDAKNEDKEAYMTPPTLYLKYRNRKVVQDIGGNEVEVPLNELENKVIERTDSIS